MILSSFAPAGLALNSLSLGAMSEEQIAGQSVLQWLATATKEISTRSRHISDEDAAKLVARALALGVKLDKSSIKRVRPDIV